MGALVERLEAALTAVGVKIVPRSTMQNFHMTIGTTNSTYPMEEALEAINTAIPHWGAPISLANYHFLAPVPHTVSAKQ